MASDIIPEIRPIVTRAEAKALALPLYYTGKPCKHGHIADRNVKSCTCMACQSARDNRLSSAIYRKTKPEKIRAYSILRYAANKQKSNENSKKWAEANPERVKALRDAWNAANKALKASMQKAWVAKNREKSRRYTKSWHAKNPELRRIETAKRRARKKTANGSFTVKQIRALEVAQKHKCTSCLTSIKSGFHADHIQPLSKGGSNSISNIQLLCAACNLSKFNKDPFDWARSKGRLL